MGVQRFFLNTVSDFSNFEAHQTSFTLNQTIESSQTGDAFCRCSLIVSSGYSHVCQKVYANIYIS